MFNKSEIIQSLQAIPWFLELKPEFFQKLVNIARIRDMAVCEELFQEGDRACDLYVVLEGQVEIYSHIPGNGPMVMFIAEPLDIVGWSSMTPFVRQRTSSARAKVHSRLIAFDGEALRRMCDDDPEMGYIIIRRISNVIASRLLTTRLHLYDLLMQKEQEMTRVRLPHTYE